jgi:hypothetical protein
MTKRAELKASTDTGTNGTPVDSSSGVPSRIEKVCEWCDRPFMVDRRRADTAKCCCVEHKNLASRQNQWGTCPVCGTEVPAHKKYCSPEHYREATKGKSRRRRSDSGTRRIGWWHGHCAGPGCHNFIAKRPSDVGEENYCSRGCFLRTRRNAPQIGRPNKPIGSKGRHPDGYVTVKVGQGSRGWRLEHIVMMERHLGRPLLPGETVHHVNGVKDDNRVDNFELWVSSQPKGQRPEDIVEWAVEMLGRYAPERLAT